MFLGILSVRIILAALGETNYGIYSLVAGVVGMLGILQGTLSTSSMRFMAHSLGSNDEKLIAQTFNTTLYLHFIIGIGVVFFIELGGFFMFKYLLNIPVDKINDAKIVFHFMTFTTFVAIIAVPYDAVINSHENLIFLSLIDVMGALLKLGVAISLTFCRYNLLITYGFLLMLIQVFIRFIKQRYSIKHYKECKIDLNSGINKYLAKSILSFTTWNLFGSIAAMSVTQLRSILLNLFFGVGLNAANGIAMQVSSQVNAVSSSMTRALNPQLVKSEGGGYRSKMLNLTILSTKYSVFLFSLLAIPVILEMPYLFRIWLKKIPDFSIIFSRLILVGLLIDKFTFEITTAIRAVGKIRNFQIAETILTLLNIPVSYILFKLGYPPYTIYIVTILIGTFASIIRFYFAKKITCMNIKDFVNRSIVPILIPILISSFIAYLIRYLFTEGFLRLIVISSSYVIILLISFYKIGMPIIEKNKFNDLLILLKSKVF
jgi:O-antigen/teichoic acid export membrane protein